MGSDVGNEAVDETVSGFANVRNALIDLLADVDSRRIFLLLLEKTGSAQHGMQVVLFRLDQRYDDVQSGAGGVIHLQE